MEMEMEMEIEIEIEILILKSIASLLVHDYCIGTRLTPRKCMYHKFITILSIKGYFNSRFPKASPLHQLASYLLYRYFLCQPRLHQYY